MYVESKTKPKQVTRSQKLIYLGLSFLIILAKIIDISLNQWFKYCWWNFGLLFAKSFTSYKNFQNESYVCDVQNDSCGSLRELTELYCPHFCGRVNDFNNAGITMMFFGAMSIISEMLCLAFHVWNFLKAGFKFKRIWAVIAMPRFLYVLGFSVWIGMVKPNHEYKRTTNQELIDYTVPEDFRLLFGFYLSIGIIGVDLILMAYGILWTRKAFV